MTTWTNKTKNSTTWTQDTKNSTSWKQPAKHGYAWLYNDPNVIYEQADVSYEQQSSPALVWSFKTKN